MKKTPIILFLIFLALLAAGLIAGEAREVFERAIYVCLSCMGIG